MNKYIDKDHLYKDITRSIDFCEDILEIVERQPAAHVVEVVRCKDCRFWDDTWTTGRAPGYHYCCMIDIGCKGDFYCADGERRKE